MLLCLDMNLKETVGIIYSYLAREKEKEKWAATIHSSLQSQKEIVLPFLKVDPSPKKLSVPSNMRAKIGNNVKN